jgi:hypothetical protein
VDAGVVLQEDAGEPVMNPCLGPAADAGGKPADPFADRVVAYAPGQAAGFGQDRCPEVVLGPPSGRPGRNQSLHVLSLGLEGSIVLEFTDVGAVDGPGVDLLVFENPLLGDDGRLFTERGRVAVSEDGVAWREFPCADGDADGGYPGCAGVHQVFAPGSDGGISPTDPAVAGGDGFDLAQVGLSRARFVRIRDTGTSEYLGISGGFDLDAIAVVHGAPLPWAASP